MLLGPSHYVALDGLALPSAAAFATPVGPIPVDLEACARITDLPQVAVDDLPHAREHALEVELPFLARVLGEVALVPIVAGEATSAEVAEVLGCRPDAARARVSRARRKLRTLLEEEDDR